MRKRKRACCGMSGKWVVEARRGNERKGGKVKNEGPVQFLASARTFGVATRRLVEGGKGDLARFTARLAARAALDALTAETVQGALAAEAERYGRVAVGMARMGNVDGARQMARKAAGFGLVALAAR